MRVNIFIPCIVDQIYPHIAINMEKILNYFGVKTDYIEEQTCCGQLSYKNGYFDHAQKLGEKFIQEFNNGRYVVMPSVSCATMIKKYYPKIFYNTSQHNDLKQLLPKIYEFTDFLFNQAGTTSLDVTYNTDIAIHISCSGMRGYGNTDIMHKLLHTVKGLKIHELKDVDICCGFGGTFAVKNYNISSAMAKDKLMNAIDSGANYLITNDPSCLMHLQTYAQKQKLPIVPIHIADFLTLILNL